MNNQFAILALLGLVSVEAIPVYRLNAYEGDGDLRDKSPGYWERNAVENKDPNQWWGNGNGQGSEKLDFAWHAAHNSGSTADFDGKVAKSAYNVDSGNIADAQPQTKYFNGNLVQHPMGGFVQVYGPPPADAWRPSVYPDRKPGQMIEEPIFKYYTNGNGAGSEKQDFAWDIAHQAKDSAQFDKDAAYFPGIESGNKGDAQPTTKYFTNGFAQVQRTPGQMIEAPIFQYYTDGKGAGSEKQDSFWDIAHQAADQAQFYKDAAYFPGVSSGNAGDAQPTTKYYTNGFAQMQGPPAADAWRPSVYPKRQPGQMIEAPLSYPWTNGNGKGSEKHDWVNDIAFQAKDTAQFDKDAAYFPGITSESKKDTEPTNTNYFGGPQAAASL